MGPLIGILYFVSAVGSAFAPEVYSFMIARFIGGLGVGISTVAAPLYIAEISPPAYRGRLAGMFQFNIVFGILIAFLSNALLGDVGEHAWRWMLGVEAVPALIYTLLCFGLPESPRWLIAHAGRPANGLKVFHTETDGIVPGCIFAFIASHAVGQGAVIWVFISEIFPNRNRSAGQALGSFTHWMFAAIITLVFPIVAERYAPSLIFTFFSFMMCLQLLWVALAVPETKGIPLEEMQQRLGIR